MMSDSRARTWAAGELRSQATSLGRFRLNRRACAAVPEHFGSHLIMKRTVHLGKAFFGEVDRLRSSSNFVSLKTGAL